LVVFLAVLFAASAIVAASVAVVGWRRRRVTPAVGVLAVVATGVAYWSLADILGRRGAAAVQAATAPATPP
jgi:hypothetical protein